MLILVLEASTASAKAMIYNTDNGEMSIQTDQYLQEYNDLVTQDADGILKQTLAVGRRVAEGQKIDAIALGGTWHSLLLLDKEMNPTTRALLWSYRGAVDVEKRYKQDKDFSKQFYNTTGCTINSIYPVFKLKKLQESGTDLKNKIITSLGGYMFYKLTGKLEESESMASGSGLLDIKTRNYSPEALQISGISENQLGRVTTYSATSPLTAESAELLGVQSGIPVLPSYPDGAMNQIGEGALQNGVMTFSVGTSAAIRLSSPRPAFSDKLATWCYLTPNSYLVGAATSGATNSVDWIKAKLFDSGETYAQIENSSVDLANLPVFLPFLYGERSPGWNGDRTASFHDVLPQHGKLDFYFAVMEGVIFNVYHCYEELIKIGGKPNTIKLSGGILNSRTWTQMCCDIFGTPMELSPQKQASLMGGVALALDVLGLDGNIFKTGETVTPNPERTAMYMEKFSRYKHWYNITSPQ